MLLRPWLATSRESSIPKRGPESALKMGSDLQIWLRGAGWTRTSDQRIMSPPVMSTPLPIARRVGPTRSLLTRRRHQAEAAAEFCANKPSLGDTTSARRLASRQRTIFSIYWLNTAFWVEQSKHRLQPARGTYAERRASKTALSNICSIHQTVADQGF
jgi:hypothetical protein